MVLLNVLQCKTLHSRKSHGSSLTNSLNLNAVKLGFDPANFASLFLDPGRWTFDESGRE